MTETPSEVLTSDLGLRDVLRVPVRLWILLVFMVLGFGGGFFVRGLEQQPAPPPPATGPVQQAPPLSDDQLKGNLPTGHPGVSSGTAGDAATAGPR